MAVLCPTDRIQSYQTCYRVHHNICEEQLYRYLIYIVPFKDEAQTALFKDPVRTAQ